MGSRLLISILEFLINLSLVALIDVKQYYTDIPLEFSCPRIVGRSEWKARKAVSTQQLDYSPTPYVVVHHGGVENYCYNRETCSEIVRNYQNWHMNKNKWVDIGYQFVIGEDGNVYEGRGWDFVGAQAPGYNTQSIGVCIIGNFNDSLPNEVALRALRSLMDCGVALGKIRRDFYVIGHRQARDTLCPGDTLYKYVQTLPNWTDNPVPIFSNQSRSIRSLSP